MKYDIAARNFNAREKIIAEQQKDVDNVTSNIIMTVLASTSLGNQFKLKV